MHEFLPFRQFDPSSVAEADPVVITVQQTAAAIVAELLTALIDKRKHFIPPLETLSLRYVHNLIRKLRKYASCATNYGGTSYLISSYIKLLTQR